MSASLKDAVVFVTGASSGIGRATSVAFARQGALVVAAGRRLDRLEALANQLGGNKILPIQLDVRDSTAVQSSVGEVHRRFGRIDVLVNNAGLARGLKRVEEGDEDEWDEMVDTNVMGLLWMTRATIPIMRAQRRGHIVNIGSVAGHEAYAGGSVYAGSKFAVRAITQALRFELLGSNIRISSVDPGLLESEFSLVRFEGDAERAKSVYRGVQPLQPEDVAECILFAVSRPPHVNVDEIIVKPTAQASSTVVHRRE